MKFWPEPDGDLDDGANSAPRRPHERLHQHWEAHFAFTPVDVRLAQALTRRFGASMLGVGPLPTVPTLGDGPRRHSALGVAVGRSHRRSAQPHLELHVPRVHSEGHPP